MRLSILLVMLLSAAITRGQHYITFPLPENLNKALHDSTTSVDVVFLQGKGGSISIEGANVRFFNSLFQNTAADKLNVAAAGNMMWLIDGREFLSGNFYLTDSTGFVIFNKNGKEYGNIITTQGCNFFKNQLNR